MDPYMVLIIAIENHFDMIQSQDKHVNNQFLHRNAWITLLIEGSVFCEQGILVAF